MILIILDVTALTLLSRNWNFDTKKWGTEEIVLRIFFIFFRSFEEAYIINERYYHLAMSIARLIRDRSHRTYKLWTFDRPICLITRFRKVFMKILILIPPSSYTTLYNWRSESTKCLISRTISNSQLHEDMQSDDLDAVLAWIVPVWTK